MAVKDWDREGVTRYRGHKSAGFPFPPPLAGRGECSVGKTPVLLLGAGMTEPTHVWFSGTFASTLQGMCEDDPNPISHKKAAKA